MLFWTENRRLFGKSANGKEKQWGKFCILFICILIWIGGRWQEVSPIGISLQ
jgi:hypothetical protein